MGAREVLEQLLVGRGLLQRVELGPVKVLQEGVAQHVGVIGLADDGRDSLEPRGALYCFPRLDPEVYPIEDDEAFVIELLRAKKILVTHGTGFNWFEPDHFRLVTLPDAEVLTEAIGRIGDFLTTRR